MDKTVQQTISWPELAMRLKNWRKSHTGWVAELSRVGSVNQIADRPAYYRLIQGIMPAGRAAERTAFLIPWVGHNDNALPLGTQFKQSGISEKRLFQMLRSEPPRDIELLRRLLQQLKQKGKQPSVDWNAFGKTMHYWGKYQKRRIVEQYFLNHQEQKDSEE